MISIHNYFSRSYIYPRMDPVNPQYVYNVVFVTENYFVIFLQDIKTDSGQSIDL